MTLTFLGTRGNILIRSRRHWRHSALLLSGRKGRLLIDCGADWAGRLGRLRPAAVLVTHGHPDHADGLRQGAACPVYATAATWRIMARWPLRIRHELPLRRPFALAGFVIEACPVQHSQNAPAVGFKVSAPNSCLFYVPDVAALDDPVRTLRDVNLYIGDGAVLEGSMVRSRGAAFIGHASVAAQLDWCRRGGVGRAIFSHCGSGIVRSEPSEVETLVRSLGRTRGIAARVAYDGLNIRL